MIERRKYKRVKCAIPAGIVLNNYDYHIITIKDLSEVGLMAISDVKIEENTTFEVKIKLSEDNHFEFVGYVVRCEKAKNNDKNYYNIGVLFLDLDNDKRKKLKSFIEEQINDRKNANTNKT